MRYDKGAGLGVLGVELGDTGRLSSVTVIVRARKERKLRF